MLNNNLANKLVNGTLQVGVDTTLNIAINKVYLLSIMSSAENYVGYYLICRTGSAIVISPLKASKDLIINTGTNTISISHPQYALAYRLFLLE